MDVKSCALVLARRGERVASGLKKGELNALMGPITETEERYLDAFARTTKKAREIAQGLYGSYGSQELLNMLKQRTGKNFPLVLSYLPATDAKACSLAYYMLEGCDVEYSPAVLTEEQEMLTDPNLRGMAVCNAGPGTGKTFTCNQRAYNLKRQGVLLLSYSNESINENYRRLKSMPGLLGLVELKTWKKSFTVSTVDSLAFHVLRESRYEVVELGDDGNGFDDAVRQATGHVRGGSFCCRYRHIVVDEAQDIDNLRGELILSIYRYCGIQSMVVFGDPRQRLNERAGRWYSDLWKMEGCEQLFGKPFCRLGLSYTHRFKNPSCLEVMNELSERRPDIHHPLRPHPSVEFERTATSKTGLTVRLRPRPVPIECVRVDYADEESLKTVLEKVEELRRDRRLGYSDFCFVFPTFNKENASSLNARKLMAFFRDNDVYCSVGTYKNFHVNGVHFSTIHAVKGKEFEVVFLVGMEGYPEGPWEKIISYGEGESLVFVAHTRARSRMFYLSSRCVLPRGIGANRVSGLFGAISGSPSGRTTVRAHTALETAPESPSRSPPTVADPSSQQTFHRVSELVKDHDFNRFLDTNRYRVDGVEEFSFRPFAHPDVERDEPDDATKRRFRGRTGGEEGDLDRDLWGAMCGTLLEMCCCGRYPSAVRSFVAKEFRRVDAAQYREMSRRGAVVDGFVEQGTVLTVTNDVVNSLRDGEGEELARIVSTEIGDIGLDDLLRVVRANEIIKSGHAGMRYAQIGDRWGSFDDLKTEMKKMGAALVERFGRCEGVERRHAYDCVVGSCDLLFERAIVEIKVTNGLHEKENRLQAFLYGCLDRASDSPNGPPGPDGPSGPSGPDGPSGPNGPNEGSAPDVDGEEPCGGAVRPTYLLNLRAGRCDRMVSERNRSQWRHALSAYCQIYAHVGLTEEKKTSLRKRGKRTTDVPPNSFAVDTEFTYNARKQVCIFDVAVVNLNDPYRSIVQPVEVNGAELDAAVRWLSCGKDLFENAATLEEVRDWFEEIVKLGHQSLCSELTDRSTAPGKKKAVLYNYMSGVDSGWAPSTWVDKVDLSKAVEKVAHKVGYFTSAMTTPKLTEFYEAVSSPLEFVPHLKPHTALSDALILYELLHTVV